VKPSLLVASLSAVGALVGIAAELEAREWTAKDGTIVKYRWSAPETLEPGKTYPLVLFLHGAGERGTDNTAQLKHGVLPILEGAKKLKQPVFLIAPQCPDGRWWSEVNRDAGRLREAGKPNPLVEAVLALAEETQAKQPVDAKRFYVTGISMGGYGTWDVLARIPNKVAAAIPICGGGDPDAVGRFTGVPIWAFHGDADAAVPVSATRKMISALETAGAKPKVTYYPGVGHDSWTQTYNNPEVIRWMFEQHRD
jgi:predicted peptidase